jgi:aromatic-L-amino-acid decarboxylase
MNIYDFRGHAHNLVDWMADYLENIESYPVKSAVGPGDIFNKIPDYPPENGEEIKSIMEDLDRIIMPGMTHWQSPNFFAYFPANSSYPSLLAEMVTSCLGAQCMIWETSPAAAELEEKMMNWLGGMIGIPQSYQGVIQDTASTATLTALLTAREKFSNYEINENGLRNHHEFRIYCSTETHSSIEKAVKIAGFGRSNLVKIQVDQEFRISPKQLERAIVNDLEQGKVPLCMIATIGTTGTTAIDPLKEISDICSRYRIWLHVDAAMAGTALILPEFRWMIEGIESVDSFVFNPHKWMFTNFDCSAYFVRDAEALIRTFEILPEYLKTPTRGVVNDYRDWGIPLGRRFRALKLWFVIREFGVSGLQEKIRNHLALAVKLKNLIKEDENFELMAPVPLNTVCFRFSPTGCKDEKTRNLLNEQLLQELNNSGKLFLTHTKLNGRYTLRMVTAQTNVSEQHVLNAWKTIREFADRISKQQFSQQ